MGIEIFSSSEPSRQGLPDWLEAFDWVNIDAGGQYSRRAAGHCVLLYVVDGVLDLRQGPTGLRRSLPGELAVLRGLDSVTVGNGSHVDALKLCVIAIADRDGGQAHLASRYFSDDDKSGAFRVVANETGESGALAHGAPPRLSLTRLARGETVVHEMASPGGWACAISGSFQLGDASLEPGDCALMMDAEDLRVSATSSGQLLLIEQHG